MTEAENIIGEAQRKIEDMIKAHISGKQGMADAEKNEAVRWVHLIEAGKKTKTEVGR